MEKPLQTEPLGENEFAQSWGVVVAATVGIMASCITLINYSLGVFVIPLEQEFGWSRHEVLLGTTFVTSGALITSFIAGWLTDRINVGWLIVFSQLGFGIALASLGLFTHDLHVFYGIHLAIAFVAGGTLPITFTRIIARRFFHRRGLALGLALAGTGFAGFILPPYIAYFVSHFGWRVGYLAVAAVPLCIAMPLSILFLREKSNAIAGDAETLAPYGVTALEAVRSWRFWVLATALFTASAAATGVSANMVPMMINRGFIPQTATNLAAVYGLAVIAGRVIIGSLVDRYWAPKIAIAFLGPAALATVFLAIMPPNIPTAVVLIAAVGLATGAEGDLLAYLVTQYFGIRAYGRIFAGVFVAYLAAIAISAPFFAYTYDVTRSYVMAMEITAFGWFVSSVLLLTLGPYPVWTRAKGTA